MVWFNHINNSSIFYCRNNRHSYTAPCNQLPLSDIHSRLPDTFDTTYADNFNLENAVVQKLLLEKIFKEPSLTDEERKLLKLMYDNPNITLDELANQMKWGYREKVRRTLKRIRMKLQKYKPYD